MPQPGDSESYLSSYFDAPAAPLPAVKASVVHLLLHDDDIFILRKNALFLRKVKYFTQVVEYST